MFLKVSIFNFKEMNLRFMVCLINLIYGFFKEKLFLLNLGLLYCMF